MRLVQRTSQHWHFRLTRRDRVLLKDLLLLYPAIPSSYHRLSRSSPPAQDIVAGQELLTEAMAAQRTDYRLRIERFLREPRRFTADGNAYRLRLDREEMEWLLQVLNDVRVGTWISLGCPDPDQGETPAGTAAEVQLLVRMELAGMLQCVLLEALGNA